MILYRNIDATNAINVIMPGRRPSSGSAYMPIEALRSFAGASLSCPVHENRPFCYHIITGHLKVDLPFAVDHLWLSGLPVDANI